MTIVQMATQWLKEPTPDNGQPEDEEIVKARSLITGLVSEIRCLKIQVCDRGNSFRDAIEENKRLQKLIDEIRC